MKWFRETHNPTCVVCFIEWSNTDKASTSLQLCAFVYSYIRRPPYGFSSLFKRIHVVQSSFNERGDAHSIPKLMFVEYFRNYKSSLNSEHPSEGEKHIDQFSTKRREVERWEWLWCTMGEHKRRPGRRSSAIQGCSFASCTILLWLAARRWVRWRCGVET